MPDTKQVKKIKPLTFDKDGYPCFIKRDYDRKIWDNMTPEMREFREGYYEYLQEEYDTPDPHFGQICTAATFGF